MLRKVFVLIKHLPSLTHTITIIRTKVVVVVVMVVVMLMVVTVVEKKYKNPR